MSACACWRYDAALGHDGHCCFLKDDRSRGQDGGPWRAFEDVCHRNEYEYASSP